MRAAGKQQEIVAGDSRLLENFDKASMKPSFAFIEFPHHGLREPKQPLAPKNLIAYRFTRIAFGVISSPFLLAAVIQLHLSGYKSPVAPEIARNTYVDNILISANTAKEAKEKIVESKHIFADAKMNLREYISNSSEVNESVPVEDRWNPDTDELSISFIPKEVSAQRGYSKRTILRI
ncbi:Pao retrotransposon peptidase family protein [Ditylenchus destructor]|uniref:Pao retrotransposon peptidase family protein n=1 Tax=Ditylenchus destructor TaxID=166010 RepID=A0AAD4NEF8_9BILA|nr:Pao retrotransposon peptidase family protein [Ditylenchus destructor]